MTGAWGTRTLLAILSEVTQDLLEQVVEGKISDVDELKRMLKKLVQERAAREVGCPEWKRELVKARIEELLRAEKSLGKWVVVLEARLDDAGLVGASGGVLNAVLEVGIAWDHVLDLPLVPGSSLKGAFRSTLLLLCIDKLYDTDKRGKCLESLADLLGWLPGAYDVGQVARLLNLKDVDVKKIAEKHAHAGLLTFHDTYLLCNKEGKLLEPWVITPHYRDARTEYDAKPNPVEHLVLAPGLQGVFIVGVEKDAVNTLTILSQLFTGHSCRGKSCLEFLSYLLAAVLSSGVGARTSRGYSRFRVKKIYVGW